MDTEQRSLSQRYILTQVGQQKLAFAADSVLEIITFKRSQMLSFPFYNSMMLGVVYYRAKLVPIIDPSPILKVVPSEERKETVMAVRLSRLTGELAGVGLLVERTVGSISREQLINYSEEPPIQVFQLEDLPSTIWQPQRWCSVKPAQF